MKINFKVKLHNFDWLVTIIILLLATFGLFFIHSTTTNIQVCFSKYFYKQLFGLIFGFFIYLFFYFKKPVSLRRLGYTGFIITLGLLIFTIIKGSVGMGAQRWINLGIIKFQPSELAKLFFPAFLVYYLYENGKEPVFKNIFPLLTIFSVCLILILKQPDLGTAILVGLGGLILFAYAGLSHKFFISMFFLSIITAPICWKFLKPYQKKRIEIFLGGGSQHKERYQIEQAKIAIGSGNLWGKGYTQGTQNRLSFLPEKRTDFIFAIICEELGFVGALIILFLYLILFVYQLLLIGKMSSWYDQLLALGLITPLIGSTIINIAMTTQLAPVVGIPLPFISYGITNLWISLAAMGWINNIIAHQK